MDVVVLGASIERIGAGEIVERGVDLFEIPCIARWSTCVVRTVVSGETCLRSSSRRRQGHAKMRKQDLEAVDFEMGLLARGRRWMPAFPASIAAAGVEGCSQQGEDNGLFPRGVIHTHRVYPVGYGSVENGTLNRRFQVRMAGSALGTACAVGGGQERSM